MVQAPAAEVGRMARVFRPLCGQQPAVMAAGRVHESHGERDAHRLFRRYLLRLEVPTSSLHVPAQGSDDQPVDLPFLKITHFFSILLKRHPKVLFGGLSRGEAAEDLCDLFWERYQLYHPQHLIFERYSREERRRILPLAFHGDKGRGYQKSPVFCFMFETVFAIPSKIRRKGSKRDEANQKRKVYAGKLASSCSQRAKESFTRVGSTPKDADCAVLQKRSALQEAMGHNGKGNSLFSRYLVTLIPKKTLSKNSEIVPALLAEVANNFTELFETGVRVQDGTVYRAALIGCKGDFEFLHLDAGKFNRTYLNEGRKNFRMMCPECWAGLQQYPATDMSDNPDWLTTLYRDEPWTSTPPLNLAPFSRTNPVFLYKRDPFHTLKYGFCRDLAASVLVFLCYLEYFDGDEPGLSRALDARLERAFSFFSMWSIAEGKCPTLKQFSLANLHRKKANQYPWLPGKGSDTVLVMMFLDFFVANCRRNLRDPSHQILLSAIQETLNGGLDYLGILHSHGLFLSHSCGVFMHQSGLKLLRGYSFLADYCIRNAMRLFSLRPKCHYFHHSLVDMEKQLALGHAWVCSPAIWNCENNEDFVGRLSRLSRRVSPRLATQRVVDRYLLGVKLLYRRAGV